MKTLLLSACLLMAICSVSAQTVVGSGQVWTAPGIGGTTQLGYAFAKGDKISIAAQSTKQLDRMLILLYPDVEIGRSLQTKSPHYSFTMPRNGIVVFRFISDRDGTNSVSYQVSRRSGSAAGQRYDTRVVWLKPREGEHGDLIPIRKKDLKAGDESRVAKLIR